MAECFLAWVRQHIEFPGLLPINPLIEALNYIHKRRWGLEVQLTDSDVPIDNNPARTGDARDTHGGRPGYSVGRASAQDLGIMQALIVTCRVHDVDPYDYLVDVLPRVDQHPASGVHELTPRLWNPHFTATHTRQP